MKGDECQQFKFSDAITVVSLEFFFYEEFDRLHLGWEIMLFDALLFTVAFPVIPYYYKINWLTI